MSETNKEITLPFISEAEIAELSVTALSDRPNERSGQYGRKGLTPAELKAAFSALPKAIALRLNEVLGVIKSLFTSIKERAVGFPDYDETEGTLTFKSLDGEEEKRISTVSITKVNECVSASSDELKEYADGTASETRNYVNTTAANAIKANVSAPAIVLDDVSGLDSNIKITTSPKISSLKLFTRNIADISKATAYGSGQVSAPEPNEYGMITQPWIVWIAGGTYYVQIPMYIPEGCTVSYSFEWEPDNSADVFKRTTFVSSSGGTVFDKMSTRGTFVASGDIYGMRIYKDVPGTGLSGNVSINNICVSLTNYAEYTPFATPATVELSNGGIEDTVENNYDNLTLVPPEGSGKVTVSAQYTRDSTLVINKLEKQIAALQTAIAT